MLEFKEVTKYFGKQTILEQASFRINSGERVGIVGPNGAGKSTLFALINGQEESDKGEIIYPKQLRLGHLRQQLNPQDTDESVLEYVLSGATEIQRIQQELQVTEQELEAGGDEALEKLGKLEEAFQHLGGYDLKHRSETALSGLGFKEEEFGRPFAEFSGGWQMRAELARTLIANPDILLLDEPSNFLDVPAVEWLQRFIKDYEGTLLLISHDRFLLRSLTNITLEIAGAKSTRYAGDYNYYLIERESRYEQQLAAWKNNVQKREELERFIERFKAKATKARQAQSRVKLLEKMEVIDEPVALKNRSLIRIAEPPHSGHEIIRLENIGHAYDPGEFVFKDISVSINKGDRVGLIGFNGMGKTTLLRILSGVMEPSEGKRVLGHQVVSGYQSQEYAETMSPEKDMLEVVRERKPEATQAEARSLLGSFGFMRDDVYKKCSVLSGGEKIRLAFARLFIHPPNLLILDEPTTHLDIDGRRALEEALQDYKGTVVLVSHDIDFIRASANRIFSMRPGGMDVVNGDYDYFCAQKGGMAVAELSSGELKKAESKKESALNYKEQKAAQRRCEKTIRVSEEKIEELEVEQRDLGEKLSSGEELDYQVVNERLEVIQQELTQYQQDWEEALELLEDLA